jgi:hypothetical protein
VPERQRRLGRALDGCTRFVLSGSLVGWGDPFVHRFELVVFLWTPEDARMEQIARIEARRLG